MEYALRMENITKKFGSFIANDSINFSVKYGEVHTLLGENGAGKSTLMNILFGLYQPTIGQIFIKGKKVKIGSPAIASRLGIGMVHQHFMLIEAMSVFENIILGVSKDKSILINKRVLKRDILELSRRYGLDIDLDKGITEISVGEQQRVEILKALYRGAEILVLDEPTAVLTDDETKSLFDIIKKLVSERKSIIFISHKMKEVMAISNRITILRHGKAIATFKVEDTNVQELANTMVGNELKISNISKVSKTENEVIHIKNVSYNKDSKHSGLNNISLKIFKGEILGIAGVDGNGQSQLAQLVSGMIKPDQGSVFLKGKEVRYFTPIGFIKANVSHIPEDRNRMGLIGEMSIKENLILKSSNSASFSFFHGLKLKKQAISKYAEKLCKKYDIRCSSVSQFVKNLSGGNQQKVILARELEQNPDLLVAVQPTRGLDIGATQYVHNCMIRARDAGCAILFISADLDEVLKMSDRIAVMFEGKIMGIFSGENPPIKQIALAMSGNLEI
jgi:ABC-type uncharacterized transport system ATPase subunit